VSEEKTLVAQVKDRILLGQSFHDQVDFGAGFAQLLADVLYKEGFKNDRAMSQCTKATREYHLVKKQIKVEIITAYFLGVYTSITVRA